MLEGEIFEQAQKAISELLESAEGLRGFPPLFICRGRSSACWSSRKNGSAARSRSPMKW